VTVSLGAAVAAWYWTSPWPVALGAALVALAALDEAISATRQVRLLGALTMPARPMRIHWMFSVVVTDRAWDTIGVPAEQRAELQEALGKYEPARLTKYLFEGHDEGEAWISRPLVVSYERWGASLERWTIWNSWTSTFGEGDQYHEKRVVEFLPVLEETDRLVLCAVPGAYFFFEDGWLTFLTRDKRTSIMPDGRTHVMDTSCVLFKIPAPTLDMSGRGVLGARPALDAFAAPEEPSVTGYDRGYYGRSPGDERFQCIEWARGFRWDLSVHDLRPCLDAHVFRVGRSLWKRRLKWMTVELDGSGVRLVAYPAVIESPTGRSPKRNDWVRVTLGDDGEVDRVWLRG